MAVCGPPRATLHTGREAELGVVVCELSFFLLPRELSVLFTLPRTQRFVYSPEN